MGGVAALDGSIIYHLHCYLFGGTFNRTKTMRMKGLGTLWISGRSTNLPNGRRLWRFSSCNCRWQWDWDMENGKPMSFPSQSTSQYAPELTTATWVLSTEPFHSEHCNVGSVDAERVHSILWIWTVIYAMHACRQYSFSFIVTAFAIRFACHSSSARWPPPLPQWYPTENTAPNQKKKK